MAHQVQVGLKQVSSVVKNLFKKKKLSKNKCLQVPKQSHAIETRVGQLWCWVWLNLWPIKLSFSIESFVIISYKYTWSGNSRPSTFMTLDPQSPGLRFFFFLGKRKRTKKTAKKNKSRRLGKTVKLRPNLSIFIPNCFFDTVLEFFRGRIEIDLAKLLVHLCLSVGWGLG